MFILRIISAFLSLYSLLCLLRIIITWIPNYSYSKPADILAQICDPYMNLFRGIKWLRFGSFDFSPALALCILGAGSQLFSSLANGGYINLQMILAMILGIFFSILSSLIFFLIILFAIRLILIMINRDSYNTSGFMANQIDSSISSIVYRIARTFAMGRRITYKAALIISIIALLFLQFALRILLAFILSIIL
ncbi:MAG: YggT family protein [Treponema succinifaciens]|uniref:YggT family protein n=1 Tax=Treponema TaxID=157 RepID=UPI0023F56217|nr:MULTISPECIES: YggT family protein [Treponema]MDD6961543.1 YggT family protein [Treponema succinifaciens]MDY2615270.1 YggT family protein [Treponema succinifaciens]MDY5118072.1 YggT family protein [Treponema succinifaciens]